MRKCSGFGYELGNGRERGRAGLIEARAIWRGYKVYEIVLREALGFRPIAPEPPNVPRCRTACA